MHLNFEEDQEFDASRQQATGNRQQGREKRFLVENSILASMRCSHSFDKSSPLFQQKVFEDRGLSNNLTIPEQLAYNVTDI
ncbi:MAG: hypothetical protein SXA11_14780 [Cyanobacteriota bacterium]|nr:hypothetical protein [Cyanobacteriota bacterium]